MPPFGYQPPEYTKAFSDMLGRYVPVPEPTTQIIGAGTVSGVLVSVHVTRQQLVTALAVLDTPRVPQPGEVYLAFESRRPLIVMNPDSVAGRGDPGPGYVRLVSLDKLTLSWTLSHAAVTKMPRVSLSFTEVK